VWSKVVHNLFNETMQKLSAKSRRGPTASRKRPPHLLPLISNSAYTVCLSVS